jgi:inorganic phosphate transporter, PiT family
MGSKITKLRPVDGFAAETAGGVMILALTHFGMPVSTTHSIAGSIMGVGATKRLSAVRWGVSARIIWAWVITIPASAGISMSSYYAVRFIESLMGSGVSA